MMWLIFALLTGAAVMAVLLPLAMRGETKDAGAADIAFFEEQLAEIARERAEGRLDPVEAEAAKTEAARRLLRAEAAPKARAEGSRKAALVAALAAMVIVPAVSLPLYLRLGKVEMPDMPLTARLDSQPDKGDLAGAVARIEQHLREHPEDGRGFEVVAPYYLRSGRGEEAIDAYSKALKLLGATAERHANLGQARMIVAEGKVTPQARQDFEAALALDPGNVMAAYYLGVGAEQAGEKDKAVGIFEKLEAEASADASYLPAVKRRLAALRGEDAQERPPFAQGPASAQGKAIAAMPADERAATIKGMVDKLASRLESKGDDVEGWLRLIRAYSVLSEPEKAKKAVEDARKALAGKLDEVARIEALAKELNIGG
ncbi:c-type cytochrome biogenesis protein CcmI [Methylocystis sp. Sn-Cys]|uniref:c-type cytochrome biogenesis protein CcmI n=1 Tax=Methylocystis sp. Sn-Cys TaxID=1701263 RepID=UPI0019216C0C|nr:c-type cytochrome biogenesis protein CcmI [Methylocystis sp. Sn-Cys]MBL1255768.1 c-type cytochrome biogenesis protein CcmI [Methylocystis sp. Sn-Cys]